jgi:hypothetical protein
MATEPEMVAEGVLGGRVTGPRGHFLRPATQVLLAIPGYRLQFPTP